MFVVLALCVFDGRNYSLGESWMDNACLQCTCLHPIGVGCCETWVLVHNSILLWRFSLAWKYYNKKRRKHWKHIFFNTTDYPGCTGLWIFPHGVRCGWSQLPAKCPWSRQQTPVCPASPVKTSRTPATGCPGYSSQSRGRSLCVNKAHLRVKSVISVIVTMWSSICVFWNVFLDSIIQLSCKQI